MSALPAVLITGASTGIGAACALHLADRGYRVYAGYRDLPAQSEARILPVRLDVTQTQDWQAVVEKIASENPESGLFALVNNAGIGLGGPIEYLPLEKFRQQFEVNFFAVIQGIQICLPLLRQGSPGKIVNISSVNGQIITPFLSPYCSSKFALEALTESLRHELAPWKIDCSLIQPGMVQTPIFIKSQHLFSELKNQIPEQGLKDYSEVFAAFEDLLGRISGKGIPPLAVAETLLKILNSPHPRLRYPVGKDAKIGLFLRKVLPDTLFESLLRKISIARSPR
ncbi:short-chain dehydrogenase/reductase [bacterium (Candidatus Blackallbacteria) CG17_big_fil_post_rev_8_21_14_2_50_48_46]|uniref:Short-chain dehydrogenase/reductase n=1 Tax=bacterium (Candidatus Blackallbacteria) CG17_big_fil_post_rev_8_21_14_2_50_48_46 TaxID=2014261 RepID=A0A2M7FY45_9BACT|nr:MAG: short-chain dehydrogenase/reductase [bacterium (Candidatus Blackallbacteria) CG18_big_fil_WC_8_21_14_2_50_49_26]PIW14234.1 MAG: short-chain dehydrogenase/reductase [bacterium (Candidatus Blackallbacteria) CG17_big_fil_post_rev_8_21_14_2_50_48_46]PIW46961.1 MAG: short-chain dehydrogenase/reductase [bacterium (Candidatus Blackallbacteria) CG13_big_fil_rev_8_21_14_2_50_49_14]